MGPFARLLGAAALACSAFASSALAADFPSRPLRFVVPFGAGGTSDLLARLIATRLGERLGQTVIVENRPGAGTAIGVMAVRNAEPDGHTFVLSGTSSIVNQALDRSVGYDLRTDFAAVSVIGEVPYAMVVNPKVPAANLKELIALMKAQPGKLAFASGGVGSSNHFATELLLAMTGTSATHIPYNSSAAAIQSIMTGETQFGFDTPVTARPQVNAGALRALAMSTPARARSMPDLPTVAESGVPGYEVTGFFAVLVPARTPKDVVARLNRELVAAVNQTELGDKMLAAGIETRTSTPEAAQERFMGELARWTRLAQDLKLQK